MPETSLPLPNVSVTKADIESGLAAALAALAVVEKFDSFMPAQVKSGVTLLVEVLTFAEGVLGKV